MTSLHRLLHNARIIWLKLVEPPGEIIDPDKRFHIRVVNSLLVIFPVLATIVVFFRLILSTASEERSGQLFGIVLFAFLLIAFFYYVINRLRKYDFIVPMIFVMGYIIIVLNILLSQPPHIEILYLIFMPLVSTILLSTSGTVLVSITTLFIAFLLALLLENQLDEVAIDMLAFMVFAQTFIVFATYQRSRLEIERRGLIVAQENQRVVHDVIANLSHDLKTPLTIINTSLYLLERTTDPVRQKEKIAQIQLQSSHLDKIVQDIIKISRLEHDREITLMPIQLDSLLEICVNRVLPAMQSKQITFTKQYSDDSCIVMVNADDLGSMFINLLSNAVTYTPASGAIYLETSLDKNCVKVTIQDTGIGIDAEDLPRIFNRFYRADKARSMETGGTGLGLAIAKHVVALHSGQISAESVIGQGSTFTVTLPLSNCKRQSGA